MSYLSPLVALILLLSSIVASAQKPLEIMQPKGEFNIELAGKMLNEGDAEIKGIAYYEDRTPIGIKVGPTIYARVATIVTLYPVTPYLEEYLSLKKKNKEGKRLATISRLASSFRIETKVFSPKGEFVFKGLQPGKYYIESMVYFPSGIGGKEVSAIVEIKTEGEIAECKLKHIF